MKFQKFAGIEENQLESVMGLCPAVGNKIHADNYAVKGQKTFICGWLLVAFNLVDSILLISLKHLSDLWCATIAMVYLREI